MYNCIIVRFGEIGIKGHITRRRMQSILAKNIESALTDNGFKNFQVKVLEGRILVTGSIDIEKAIEPISRVFGVTSVSPAYSGNYSDLNDLIEKASSIAIGDVKGKVFMVRANRAGEPRFTSKDVERLLGQKLLELGAGKVNLEKPEVTIFVDVRAGSYFLFTEKTKGPGGLPLGSEGKVLALVSGGIDSPVAAWMMMKRGAKTDIVFFNIGGKAHVDYFLQVAKRLVCRWAYGYEPQVAIVEHRWIFPYLTQYFPEGFRPVALKISMYVSAEAIAKLVEAKALVTGESLAQVSSQTLHNLIVSDKAVGMTIFRPLIGMDKEEITEFSRKIGTYEISSKVPEFCALASTKASTTVDEKKIYSIFQRYLPFEEIKKEAMQNCKFVKKSELCS